MGGYTPPMNIKFGQGLGGPHSENTEKMGGCPPHVSRRPRMGVISFHAILPCAELVLKGWGARSVENFAHASFSEANAKRTVTMFSIGT